MDGARRQAPDLSTDITREVTKEGTEERIEVVAMWRSFISRTMT
jgi:hypothetical protein